ncbi:MAG: phosphodiester glycosidase family protein [Alistipes sp.]|nr:phosphodiester glycosidase family protein [Alistipes sp.]
MKKCMFLAMLFAGISLCISCQEKKTPEYVFPEPETTPAVTITPIEKGTDFVTLRFVSSYAEQCAYLYAEGESLTKSAEEIFAEGTTFAEESLEVKVEGLTPATAYTFIAAAKDATQMTVATPVTVVTASDAPKSNYPDKMSYEPFTIEFEDGGVAKGYIVTADLKANDKLRFAPTLLDPAQTPTDAFDYFKSLEKGTPYALTNGGYFWAGASLSLCVSDGEVKSIATELAYPTVDGEQIVAYPVRAAFGQMADGSFEATWVYCINQKPYSFPSPLDNDELTETYMSAPPTANTEGAALWEPEQAIGGGPMLVYDGENVAMEYYYREIMHTGGTAGTSRQPRTAVGGTKDGKLMLVVCDGRGENGSNGLKLSELADIFVEAGMDYAINLDGGGSSTIVGYDGEVSNSPSDGSQRSVPTVVVVSAVE